MYYLGIHWQDVLLTINPSNSRLVADFLSASGRGHLWSYGTSRMQSAQIGAGHLEICIACSTLSSAADQSATVQLCTPAWTILDRRLC